MRKIVVAVIVLLAVFTFIGAYTGAEQANAKTAAVHQVGDALQ